jgi:hypothetical protein
MYETSEMLDSYILLDNVGTIRFAYTRNAFVGDRTNDLNDE